MHKATILGDAASKPTGTDAERPRIPDGPALSLRLAPFSRR